MYKSIIALSLTAFFACLVTSNAGAQPNEQSLKAIARRDGYTLQWLFPERAVRLYRPDLVIVIRPEATMYEVNDRVEFTDAPPSYVNGDMLVSPRLAARLGRLAVLAVLRHPAPAQVRFTGAPRVAASAPITLEVHRDPGAEALSVSGRAPANAPVTITLLAIISPDLPNVVLSRHVVDPNASGEFQASIPIASDYVRNTYIHVLASAPGETPAQATVTVGAPNAGVAVPFDKPYCYDIVCPI